MPLTKEQLKARRSKCELVRLPSDGAEVNVRPLSAGELDTVLALTSDDISSIAFEVQVVLRALADGNGNRLLTDDEIDIVAALEARDLRAINAVANRLSAMTVESREELEKNSEPAPSDAPSSPSPSSSAA